MKILLATHFFPPGHVGGTEDLTRGLAQSLQAAGHTVNVICAEGWATAPTHKIRCTDEVYQDVPVRRLHFNWTKAPDVFGYLYNNPEAAEHFKQFCTQIQPDIVHITSCSSLSASIIPAARALGLPVVLTATDFWLICARNTLLRSDGTLCPGPESPWQCARCLLAEAKVYRWPRAVLPEGAVKPLLLTAGRFRWLTRQRGLRGMLGDWSDRFAFLAKARLEVDHIVTASRLLKTLLVNYGVPAERVEVSAYGLDTRWARGYETKTPSDSLRVGFIGQVVPMKGPDLLLKALAHLGPDVPVQLKLYGDLTKMPDYGRALRTLAQGDPRVSFLGTFDNSRMGEVMTGIDVLAVPSTWYDFPLVIPSAFATRTPVLATNLAGMNELVEEGRNGLLFERFDWQGLAVQIERLVQTPGLLGQLRAGIKPVKTLAQAAEEYVELYTTLQKRLHRLSEERLPG
jgi:glycosyltransferase involved in cell wall biosynthesis